MKHMEMDPPGVPWQVLGELELPVESNVEPQIERWLAFILKPLELPGDFLDKILKSAQDASARLKRTRAALRFEHIHLCVFAQASSAHTERTWGFFRIEKCQDVGEDQPIPGHTVEFYVYIEG